MKNVLLLMAVFVTIFTVYSCDKEEDCPNPTFSAEPVQLAEDSLIIEAYLDANGLNAQITESGLHYIINNEGSGGNPCSNSNVTVAYKGYFTSGEVFDESSAAGISFGLNQVISGWTEGIPLFQKGGSGVLLIPSGFAYGPNGRSGIPGNSVLIFDIELLDF